jgi:hypothetical protein
MRRRRRQRERGREQIEEKETVLLSKLSKRGKQ